LSQEDKRVLVEVVQGGAVAAGFEGEMWTQSRVRQIIAKRFGVHYSERHVGRVLKQLGLTLQKPARQASQRQEQAILDWQTTGWIAVKKKAEAEGYTIVFADESGFRLLPMLVRTWALRGQTPCLMVPLSYDHRSVMGGITLDGRLLTWQLDHACRGQDCVYFLRHLLRQIEGKVLVIWDGLPAHRSQAVKDFLSEEAAARLWLVTLPAYAPDLNPIEAIWNYLKRFELANLCTRSLDELRPHLRRAIERLRHRKNVILACFRQQFCYL